MLNYIIGIITGIIISILIVTVLTFFRRVIEHKISIIEKQVDIKAPRPKGFIIEPPDESEDIRQEIIRKNKEKGLDTPISDLL